MDLFGSSSHDNEEDEPLYCSAPQNAENIIWEGSDTEQSPEEIAKKRLRYEYHAERYLRGHLPVLQSASLRGPLGEDWVNPWRYQPIKKPGWWQPGSKDMLFTKANVMKMAADHGLAHLPPLEALAWCKSKAEAEAEAEAADSPEHRDESVIPDEQMEQPAEEYEEDNMEMESEQNHQRTRDNIHTNPEPSYSRPEHHSMSNIHTEGLGSLKRVPENDRSSMKRPADSQWLKGSYVSKRARWNSPQAASSPTPMPNHQSERERRRRRGSTMEPEVNNRKGQTSSHQRHSWSHDAQQWGPEFIDSSNFGNNAQPINISSNSRLTDSSTQDHRAASQDTAFLSAVDYLDKARLPSRFSISSRHSSLVDNPEGVITMYSPLHQDLRTPDPNRSQPTIFSAGPNSVRSPKLPTHNDEFIGDDSFVTEIAPSSRDLEKFQYRKKKRRSIRQQSVEADENLQDQHDTVPFLSPNPAASQSDKGVHGKLLSTVQRSEDCRSAQCNIVGLGLSYLSDEDSSDSEEISQELPQDHLPQNSLPQEEIPRQPKPPIEPEIILSANGEITLPEEETITAVGQFDSSWDMVEDSDLVTEKNMNAKVSPQAGIISISSAAKYETSASILEPDDGMRSQSPFNQDEIHISQTSARSELKFSDPAAPPQLAYTEYQLEEADISTQSFNTTPMRSMRSPYKQASLLSNTRPEKEKGPTARPIDEEIPDIKTELQLMNERELSSHDKNVGMKADIATPVVKTGSFNKDEEMQMIQNLPSQNFRSILDSNCQNDSDDQQPFLQGSHGGVENNGKAANSIVALDNEGSPPQEAVEHVSMRRPSPQSPWTTIDLHQVLSIKASEIVQNSTASQLSKREPSVEIENANIKGEEPDWYRIERSITPENDGIRPFKDFMTPSPSPEPPAYFVHNGELPSTQALVEATTGNPWTSAFNNSASGKSSKRVSFGTIDGEVDKILRPGGLASSKQTPGSPPPPHTVERLNTEDGFNDGTTSIDRFGKHFLATGGVKRIFAGASHSLSKFSSPAAVGAMAEAFIAADRETSIEQQRPNLSDKTSSRHLKPIGVKANNNSDNQGLSLFDSPSIRRHNDSPARHKTTDHDMGLNLDDFLGDAGGFLEEWSVEAALKKARELDSGSDANRSSHKRNLFGISSRW